MFSYDQTTRQIRTMPEIFSPVDGGQCVSVERIRPAEAGLDPFDRDGPGAYRKRFAHMLRSIKSGEPGENGCRLDTVMTSVCVGPQRATTASRSSTSTRASPTT